MDETGHCPNCGGAASLPAQEEKRRDDSTLRSGVGIFYENLAVSQAEAEQEHRPPRPARYSSGERKGIVFSVALLLAILGTVFWGCSGYDPDAAAIRGENGITMDNRTFSIYFYAAMSEAQSQYGQDGGTVPFDPTGNLERQYIDLDTGYTWADYFREQALQDAALTESLIWQAQEKGWGGTGSHGRGSGPSPAGSGGAGGGRRFGTGLLCAGTGDLRRRRKPG